MGGLFTSELFWVLNDTGLDFCAGQMYSPLITEIRNKSLNLLGIFHKDNTDFNDKITTIDRNDEIIAPKSTRHS